MLYYAFFATFVALTNGQRIFLGRCPNVQVVENFTVSRFVGTWYEEAKYPILSEFGDKCVSADYEVNPNGTITVTNFERNYILNRNVTNVGLATFVNSTSEAKLTLKFSSSSQPYWVVGTDYDNYAVAWSCTNGLFFINTQNLWVLTRARQPSQQVLDNVNKVLQANKLSQTLLVKSNQVGCD